MDRRGKLDAADEHPLGCAQIDEDEVSGRKRTAAPLAASDPTELNR